MALIHVPTGAHFLLSFSGLEGLFRRILDRKVVKLIYIYEAIPAISDAEDQDSAHLRPMGLGKGHFLGRAGQG